MPVRGKIFPPAIMFKKHYKNQQSQFKPLFPIKTELQKQPNQLKPSSSIKNANPEEATPFTMIPGLIPKEPMSHPHNKAYIRVQAWLQQSDEETPPEPEHEPWTLVQGEIPEEPLCHTHNMAYIRMKAWIQQLEGGVDTNHFYMNSELPLSFMKDDNEELYD